MACSNAIGNSVAQVSMPLGSYKLSTLGRDLQVHVANIERWGGEGRVNEWSRCRCRTEDTSKTGGMMARVEGEYHNPAGWREEDGNILQALLEGFLWKAVSQITFFSCSTAKVFSNLWLKKEIIPIVRAFLLNYINCLSYGISFLRIVYM